MAESLAAGCLLLPTRTSPTGADTERILPLCSRGEPETGGGETKTLLLLNFSGVHQPVASGEPMCLRL